MINKMQSPHGDVAPGEEMTVWATWSHKGNLYYDATRFPPDYPYMAFHGGGYVGRGTVLRLAEDTDEKFSGYWVEWEREYPTPEFRA